MDIVTSGILGIIQGITEFLPISSSGHLIIFRSVFGFAIPTLAFDVALHMGTFVALLVVFHRDVRRLLKAWARSFTAAGRGTKEGRFAWALFFATIPAGLAGLLLQGWIEGTARTMTVVAFSLFIVGVLFFVIDAVAKPRRDLYDMTIALAVVIGVAQALALIPGVSRSGITIITAMALGLNRSDAARFSFLLSIPITAAAGADQMIVLTKESLPAQELALFAVGFVASAIIGVVTIRFLLRYLRSHRLTVFGAYRILLAVLVPFLH